MKRRHQASLPSASSAQRRAPTRLKRTCALRLCLGLGHGAGWAPAFPAACQAGTGRDAPSLSCSAPANLEPSIGTGYRHPALGFGLSCSKNPAPTDPIAIYWKKGPRSRHRQVSGLQDDMLFDYGLGSARLPPQHTNKSSPGPKLELATFLCDKVVSPPLLPDQAS